MTEVTSSLADVLAKKGFSNSSNIALANYALAESVAIKIVERAYKEIIIPVLKGSVETQGSHSFFNKNEYWELYSLDCNNTISPILYNDEEYVDLALKAIDRCSIGDVHARKTTKKKEKLRINISNVQVMAEYIRAVRQMLLVQSKENELYFWATERNQKLRYSDLLQNPFEIDTVMYSQQYKDLYIEDQLFLAGSLIINSAIRLILAKRSVWAALELNTGLGNDMSIALAIHLQLPQESKNPLSEL